MYVISTATQIFISFILH